jgi:hypothetical protein
MGIQAKFKQVSPYLLEKLKEHPDFAEVFFYAELLPDSDLWREYPIDLNNPNEVADYEDFTNWVGETLQRLEEEKPEEFEKMKIEIPLIIAEGKALPLDIGKSWRELHFVLTGEDYSIPLPFLISENKEDNLPSINTIWGGKEIEYNFDYGLLRYLTFDEVKQVAEALSKFSFAQFRERLIRVGKEDFFDYLFEDTYNPLVKYYQDAAEKGKAMFLYLT